MQPFVAYATKGCRNPFPPFTFISFSPPKTAGRSCATNPSHKAGLHSYLDSISKQLDCPPILGGGVEDHVHLLAQFGRTITQAEWVKELKRVSSGVAAGILVCQDAPTGTLFPLRVLASERLLQS